MGTLEKLEHHFSRKNEAEECLNAYTAHALRFQNIQGRPYASLKFAWISIWCTKAILHNTKQWSIINAMQTIIIWFSFE